jgi:hypothetical protein
MGSLHITDIDASAEPLLAQALAPIRSIEGALVISSTTAFDLALLRLASIGSNPALLINSSIALLIVNNTGLTVGRSLFSLRSALSSGAMVLRDNPGLCLSALDIGGVGRWIIMAVTR